MFLFIAGFFNASKNALRHSTLYDDELDIQNYQLTQRVSKNKKQVIVLINAMDFSLKPTRICQCAIFMMN